MCDFICSYLFFNCSFWFAVSFLFSTLNLFQFVVYSCRLGSYTSNNSSGLEYVYSPIVNWLSLRFQSFLPLVRRRCITALNLTCCHWWGSLQLSFLLTHQLDFRPFLTEWRKFSLLHIFIDRPLGLMCT